MGKREEEVAAEWADAMVATREHFSPLLDNMDSSDPVRFLASVTTLFFSQLTTLNLSKEELSSLTVEFVQEIKNSYGRLPDIFDGLSDTKTASLNEAVASLFALGMLVGGVNARTLAEPAVRSVRATRDTAVRAGARSGEARRQRAEQTWQRHALELAVGLRKAQPSLSQANLAAEVYAGWKEAGDIPGVETIKEFVRSCERANTLTKRGTQ